MVKERMDLLELLRKGGMDGDVDFLREALRVLDLKATTCSRLRVKRLNFQTRIISNGALGLLPSSIISLNWGLSATRPLSASSMYSRATE